MYSVYGILNKVDNKIYVGSTARENPLDRKAEHFNFLRKRKHHSKHLENAFWRDGEQNFEFVILEKVAPNKKLLVEREQYWIDYFKAANPQFGYNVNPTAIFHPEVKFGPMAAEQKKRLSELFKNREITWGDKISKAKKGKPNLKLRGRHLVPRESRICICGCTEAFICKITSKQKFIYGHQGKGNEGSLGKVSNKKGKTLEEFYGPEKAIEVRQKLQESHKGKQSRLGHFKERTAFVCQICGITFYRLPCTSHNGTYKFCSNKCVIVHLRNKKLGL